MTLSKKIIITVGVAFLIMIGVLYAITNHIVLRSFAQLEEQNIRAHVNRVVKAFQDELSGLDSTAGDWGPWNETRDFVLGENNHYIKDNLTDATLMNLRVNFMIFVNSSGQLIHAKGVDLIKGKNQPASKALIEYLLGHKSLLEHANPRDSKSGVILLTENPILIAAWPISNNEFEEPIYGTLIIGRYLNDKEIQHLMEKTELSISFVRADAYNLPPDVKTAQSLLSDDISVVIQQLNTDRVAGYTKLSDIDGNSYLFLKVDVPRDIFKQGKSSADYFMLVLLAFGIIVLTVLMFTLQTTVLGPLKKLTSYVLAMKESGDLSVGLPLKRKDEIGILACEFDKLLISSEKKSSELKVVNTKLQEDIEKRRRAEKALREGEKKYKYLYKKSKQSEEIYRSLLHTSADAIILYDMKGNTTYANPSFTKIFGWTFEELEGKRITFVPEYEMEATMDAVKKIAEKGEAIQGFETKRYKKDGSIIDVNISGSRYNDHKGNPLGLLVIIRDASERKKIEAQLQYAQRMKSIGTLASGIAHNFNNLLMGIMGNASIMLLGKDSNHPHYNKLKNIEKLAEDGSILTNQLLGYAREGKYEPKPINLNELVKETADAFSKTRKEIRVYRELADDLFGIRADQGQIEQTLFNLYVNAADAMPGGGDLVVTTMNVTHNGMKGKDYEPKPGSYVLLTISDTGIGMDKETSERIFEPFFSTKGLAEGMGLGLASVYGTIKSHGGYIDVETVKGQGTTFSIYFASTEKAVKEKRVRSGDAQMATETVLLVDDENMVVDVGKQMLEALGCRVYIANSGKEAIDIYMKNKNKIDMVILDMIMPEMSGGTAYDKLKDINPSLKVLLSSGYSVDGQATEILERGCNGFIQKPFGMTDLSQKIRDVLDIK